MNCKSDMKSKGLLRIIGLHKHLLQMQIFKNWNSFMVRKSWYMVPSSKTL